MREILGIDIGGTGMKAAKVDIKTGELLSERYKIKTPESKMPKDMINVVADLVDHFDWRGKRIGICFPAVIKDNHSLSASNIHDNWIGFPITKKISKAIDTPVSVINDADAAGIAELHFGQGKSFDGTVILLTLGTGIGSAIFRNGILLPNTELGHLKYKDSIAEKYASNSARKNFDLSWEEYGKELNEYLEYVDYIFSPDLVILGGGISKKFKDYHNYISRDINVVTAKSLNNAGIIGAAIWANQVFKKA